MRDVVDATRIRLFEEKLRGSGRVLGNLGGKIKDIIIGYDAACGGLAARKGLDIDKVVDGAETALLTGMMACDILADMLKEVEDDG